MVGMGMVVHTHLGNIDKEAKEVEQDSLPGIYYAGQIMAEWGANYSLTQEHVIQEDNAAMNRAALSNSNEPDAPGVSG